MKNDINKPDVTTIIRALMQSDIGDRLVIDLGYAIMECQDLLNGSTAEIDMRHPSLSKSISALKRVYEMSTDDDADLIKAISSGDKITIMESAFFKLIMSHAIDSIGTPITPIIGSNISIKNGVKVKFEGRGYSFSNPFVQWFHNAGLVVQHIATEMPVIDNNIDSSIDHAEPYPQEGYSFG